MSRADRFLAASGLVFSSPSEKSAQISFEELSMVHMSYRENIENLIEEPIWTINLTFEDTFNFSSQLGFISS